MSSPYHSFGDKRGQAVDAKGEKSSELQDKPVSVGHRPAIPAVSDGRPSSTASQYPMRSAILPNNLATSLSSDSHNVASGLCSTLTALSTNGSTRSPARSQMPAVRSPLLPTKSPPEMGMTFKSEVSFSPMKVNCTTSSGPVVADVKAIGSSAGATKPDQQVVRGAMISKPGDLGAVYGASKAKSTDLGTTFGVSRDHTIKPESAQFCSEAVTSFDQQEEQGQEAETGRISTPRGIKDVKASIADRRSSFFNEVARSPAMVPPRSASQYSVPRSSQPINLVQERSKRFDGVDSETSAVDPRLVSVPLYVCEGVPRSAEPSSGQSSSNEFVATFTGDAMRDDQLAAMEQSLGGRMRGSPRAAGGQATTSGTVVDRNVAPMRAVNSTGNLDDRISNSKLQASSGSSTQSCKL